MHASLKQYDHVAKCHLHTAAIMSKNRRHGDALRCMGKVLRLVDEEKLEVRGVASTLYWLALTVCQPRPLWCCDCTGGWGISPEGVHAGGVLQQHRGGAPGHA